MKGRAVNKGLIVVAADVGMLGTVFTSLSASERNEVMLSWPGNNTWVLPNQGYFPAWITGDSGYVAVRLTASPALRALSATVDGPLVSTSANPAGCTACASWVSSRELFWPRFASGCGAG